MKKGRMRWGEATPFFVMHVLALGVFFVPFAWKWVGLCLFLHFLRAFGLTAGFHRYFAHRSYKMGRVMQFVIAWIGTMAVQKGALWWAANHRLHHRFSDTPNDIHSPLQTSFWWSHMGWIVSDQWDQTRWDQIQDFAKFPELVWLNKYHWLPGTLLGLGMAWFGGWSALFWGFFLSTVMLWHATFFVNSLAHVWGTRRYSTTDTSRNNLFIALTTMGEGWHNNHHCYMSSTRQGFYWYEIDPTYYIIKMMSWVGLTWDLRDPPLALLESKRLDNGAADQMPAKAVAT